LRARAFSFSFSFFSCSFVRGLAFVKSFEAALRTVSFKDFPAAGFLTGAAFFGAAFLGAGEGFLAGDFFLPLVPLFLEELSLPVFLLQLLLQVSSLAF